MLRAIQDDQRSITDQPAYTIVSGILTSMLELKMSNKDMNGGPVLIYRNPLKGGNLNIEKARDRG
jgi:hypothetical protein